MRGRGASRGNNPDSKWNHINQLVKEKHIGVLAIQEAHLTQEHVDDLHQLFGKHLQIHFSQGQNVNAHGVAIVLNREITNIHSIQQVDIIPGRAMLLTLPWHSDLTITILNVYAPNAHNENQQFWETLELKWVNLNLPLPDIMLGDFNLVEDAIDRLPSHADPSGATNALDNLRSFLQLKDGWRTTWPTKRAFSFLQTSTGVQSHIDCIYASNDIITSVTNWNIEHTAVVTDHKMVLLNVIDPKTPFIGRGRWTMPLFLLKNEALMTEIHDLGLKFEDALNNVKERSTSSNPQILFKSFKDDAIKLIRTTAKTAVPKMEKKIEQLNNNSQSLRNDPNLDSEDKRRALGLIEERIATLETQRHQKACTATAAHDRLEGETISKY